MEIVTHTRDAQVRETGDNAAGMIRSTIERAERLHEERKGLAEDLKELFAEARGNGLSVPALKHIIKERAKDPAKRAEFRAILEMYAAAIGEVL
jgi:uncharacterized protein (UPF0335 family)